MRIASLVVAAGLFACTTESADDAGSSTGGGGSSSTGSTGSGSSGDSTAAADSSSGGPVGDGILQCVESCGVPSDCCLPGMPCPGAYPYNVDCVDGLCVPAQCDDDDSCTAIDPGQACVLVRGLRTCVTACAADGDCAGLGASYTCSGVADDGSAVCFERCDAAGVFCGNQACDPVSGLCTCETAGMCQSDWECVD